MIQFHMTGRSKIERPSPNAYHMYALERCNRHTYPLPSLVCWNYKFVGLFSLLRKALYQTAYGLAGKALLSL
jgi:hypothetical protein